MIGRNVIIIISRPIVCNAIVLNYIAIDYDQIATNFLIYDWPGIHRGIFHWIATNFVGCHWL